MIRAVLIFNTLGKARLIKFYEHYPEDRQREILVTAYELVKKRKITDCHFIENAVFNVDPDETERFVFLYRQYATLYITLMVDSSENMLAILDLIQIFVEVLDRCFESICELDIIFNMNKIHYILNEIIIGGLVVETDLDLIVANYKKQKKLENKEKPLKIRTVKKMANIRNSVDFNLKDLRRSMRQTIGNLKNS